MKCIVAVAETQDIDSSFAEELIKVWQQSNWQEEVSITALEVLTTMCERRIKLVDEVTVWICDQIISNKKLSNKLREAGCDYLFAMADFNPKGISNKQPLLKKVV